MAYVTCILAQATVIALIWFMASSNCLDLDVQPQFVRPGDKNVMFTCAVGNDTKNLNKIFRMRLMRQHEYGQWTEVAVLQHDGTIDMADGNAVAVSNLRDVHDSHLTVTWPVAPDDINGRYQCDAIVLTSNGDVVTEKSIDLNVKSLSSDVSFLLERLMKTEKKLVTRVNETMHGAMKTSKTNLLSQLDSNFGALKQYLDNKTAASIKRPEEEKEIINWPAEQFTLLMPRAGCPLHPPAWIKSFKKMEADPGDKYYPMDDPLHLAIPQKKDGFVYRQFCTLPALVENTEPWPAGSYCLYTVRKNVCPTGFTYSSAHAKIRSEKGNFFYYPQRSKRRSGTFTVSASRFCCRHDGSASIPINLPVSHPFYLFRHGGRCQDVKGMDVTQDVFMMETEEHVDFDKWIDSNPDFRPDVTFKPYREDLCYYSRKKA